MIWPFLFRPREERNGVSRTTTFPNRLPSPSTLSRRVDPVGVGLLWHALERHLRDRGEPALVTLPDGKPLPAWVRGLPRVRTWVWAKLLINAVRILRN